jgi:hypothetical protein
LFENLTRPWKRNPASGAIKGVIFEARDFKEENERARTSTVAEEDKKH